MHDSICPNEQFVGANKMKKMALNIIAGNVAEEDIGHLRKLFHSIDIDGNGVITLEELQKVVASEGLIELQSEVLAVMQGIDMDGSQTLDWREFLAASLDRTVFLKETYIRQVGTATQISHIITTSTATARTAVYDVCNVGNLRYYQVHSSI
jgi:EF-hand domain pair